MRELEQRATRGTTAYRMLVERYLDAYNNRDFDRWGELFDEHVLVIADAGTFHGRDAVRAFAAHTARQLPGVTARLERIVGETSDSIAVEYRLDNPDPSAHDWLLAGTVCDVYDITDGRIVRVHSYYLADEADRTEVAQTQARGELAALLAEQAALRRVATLVATGARPSEIFAVTAAEVCNLLAADAAVLWRYEPDDTATVIAIETDRPLGLALGMRIPIEGDSAMATIHRTGRPARQHELDQGAGAIAAAARTNGLRAAVGAPITVDGRLWGAVVASSRQAEMPDGTALRTVGFTELLATAIANADSRSQLLRSRARMLAAADDARRRVARDLHDGAQQRLVHTIVTLKLAQRAMRDGATGGHPPEVLVANALEQAESANAELRDLSHGILPVALTHHGLRPAIDDLVERAGLPVTTSVTAARLPPAVEASAYFVAAESLTNIAKHAHATRASLQAWIDETTFYLEIRDDGVGGARLDGTGLLGLQDRVTALGGRLRLESPPGGGTWIRMELPISFG